MAPHLLDGFQSGLPRVFVQVQNGCDHRCTFCIIPYGRGNSRSVPMGAVVEQVRALVERGHAEIVLTGVDLTSYGHDLPGAPKLGTLTKQILRHVPELKRLRISSMIPSRPIAICSTSSRGRAADAASASVAAGGRRFDFEADEAAAFADRGDRVCEQVRRCGRTSLSAPTSSRGFRPRPRRCSRARGTWSRNAGSPSCTCSRIRRDPARRRRGCRRWMATSIKVRAKRLRATGEAALSGGSRRRSGATRQVLIESVSSGGRRFRAGGNRGEEPGAVRTLTVAGHDGARLTV